MRRNLGGIKATNRVNFPGSNLTITAIEGLLVLDQGAQAQVFVELEDLVVLAAEAVNDLRSV